MLRRRPLRAEAVQGTRSSAERHGLRAMRFRLRSTSDVVASVPRPAGTALRRLVFMHKRKLVIALATAGLLSAGFGASVIPASADPRVLVVTLQSGEQRTVTVDLPAGTDPAAAQLPGITEPVISVQDVTPPPPP